MRKFKNNRGNGNEKDSQFVIRSLILIVLIRFATFLSIGGIDCQVKLSFFVHRGSGFGSAGMLADLQYHIEVVPPYLSNQNFPGYLRNDPEVVPCIVGRNTFKEVQVPVNRPHLVLVVSIWMSLLVVCSDGHYLFPEHDYSDTTLEEVSKEGGDIRKVDEAKDSCAVSLRDLVALYDRGWKMGNAAADKRRDPVLQIQSSHPSPGFEEGSRAQVMDHDTSSILNKVRQVEP